MSGVAPAAAAPEAPRPEPWRPAGIRRVTGCPQARPLTGIGEVTMDGERPRADCAIDVEGFRAVRADDGGRHLGDLVSGSGSGSVSGSVFGDIRCRSSRGPGPGETPRAL